MPLARVSLILLSWMGAAGAGLATETPLPVYSAHGAIEKMDNDTLTVRSRAADGKFGKNLVLKINANSKLFALTTQTKDGKNVLRQGQTDPGNLLPRQTIAVFYTDGPEGPVLLTALVQTGAQRDGSENKGEVRLPPKVPKRVGVVLAYIDENHRAPDGYEGGRTFHNLGRDGEQLLARIDKRGRSITYHEWDVNPKVQGKNRGAERMVTGSDGSAYYTGDHYRTFTKIR